MDFDPVFDNLLSTSSNLLDVTSLRNSAPSHHHHHHHHPSTSHPSQSHPHHQHNTNNNAADDDSSPHSHPFAHPDMFLSGAGGGGGGFGPPPLAMSSAAATDFDVYNLSTMLPPDFDRPMSIPFADRPPIPPMGYIPGAAAGHLMPNPAVLSLGIGPLGLGSATGASTGPGPGPAMTTTGSADNNNRHNDNKSNSNAEDDGGDDDDDDDDDDVDDDDGDDDVDDDGDEDMQQRTGSAKKNKNNKSNRGQPRRQRKKGNKKTQHKRNEHDPDNFSMDNDKDSTDALLLSTNTGTTTATAATGMAAPSSSGAVAVRGNVSHTRRCRAKVNSYFERLMDVLPTPPTGMEVKHKAQILNYAIERFHDVQRKNMQLEMRLALSSTSNLRRWVHTVVSNSRGVLSDALKPFMALICLTKGWKYAELWAPRMLPSSSSSLTHNTGDVTATNSFNNNNNNNKHDDHHHPVLRYVTGAVPPTVQGEQLTRVKEYRAKSRKFVFRPRSGVPGRVFLTMRPEWLPLLNDPIAFPRAPHAVKNKVEITFAVPVIVGGSVKMVVQFYDLERREYDPNTLNTAHEIAELFGKAFTGLGR